MSSQRRVTLALGDQRGRSAKVCQADQSSRLQGSYRAAAAASASGRALYQAREQRAAAMAKCIPRNDCLPFIMRLFLVAEVIVGILFIVFALVLQTPPKASVPM